MSSVSGVSDDAAILNGFATEIEGMADRLESVMPKMRKAREALGGITPVAARYSQFKGGSVDEFDAATADGMGFGRIENARSRLVKVLREPWDDIDLPDLQDAPE